MTTSLASPQAPGASLQFDATAQGCTSPEYRFWLRDSFGQWQVVQEWGAGPAWIWDTTGLASGAYLISVWTRAAGSSAAYEAYLEVPFTLQ